MKITCTILIAALFMVSCSKKSAVSSVDELLEIEKAFSDLSLEKGMAEAFKFYADEEVVLLRDNNYPIKGSVQLAKELDETDDSGFNLSWEVLDARIARSGDLGYTYGIYTMKSTTGEFPESKGSYVTIWKKNQEGEWRFVMDTGQEGLGEE